MLPKFVVRFLPDYLEIITDPCKRSGNPFQLYITLLDPRNHICPCMVNMVWYCFRPGQFSTVTHLFLYTSTIKDG